MGEVGHRHLQQIIHVAGQRVAGDRGVPPGDLAGEALHMLGIVALQCQSR